MSACSITNCRDGVGGAPWPPTKDLNPYSVVRSHVSCPVERMGDNWGQGWDLNPRPSGYEPDELPTAPPCYITLEVPTGLEPVHNGFAIRRLTSLAKEPYRRSFVAERATNPPFTLLRTPHSSLSHWLRLLATVELLFLLERDDTQHVCLSLLGHLYRPYQAVSVLLL